MGEERHVNRGGHGGKVLQSCRTGIRPLTHIKTRDRALRMAYYMYTLVPDIIEDVAIPLHTVMQGAAVPRPGRVCRSTS